MSAPIEKDMTADAGDGGRAAGRERARDAFRGAGRAAFLAAGRERGAGTVRVGRWVLIVGKNAKTGGRSSPATWFSEHDDLTLTRCLMPTRRLFVAALALLVTAPFAPAPAQGPGYPMYNPKHPGGTRYLSKHQT